MKLKTRLKLSFFLIAVMPVLLFAITAWALLSYQVSSINTEYGIEGTNWNSISNPIEILTKIADQLHKEIYDNLENNYNEIDIQAYFQNLEERLKEKGTELIVRKDGEFIYVSSGVDLQAIKSILPDYGQSVNVVENGIYYGGDNRCIIKQFDFSGEHGEEYCISLVIYLSGIEPKVKVFWVDSMISVVCILVIISAVMTLWIYRATIIPLDKLKEGTRNIADGNLDFVVDISGDDEISQLCKDFEFMRQKLKEAAEDNIRSDKESKELISNISHDLKTPITAIKGYVEGLRDGVAETEEKREKYLKTIYNKAIEMDRLIDELTLYSKIDTNRIPYSFNKLSVEEFFGDCADSLSVELESKNVDFKYDNKLEEDALIIADAEQLSRVINNIISNSVKYHGEKKGEISMIVKDDGDFVKIEIKDNGKGISKQDLPHIFNRMYRTDSSRNSATGGSGIGLAIVKKIIEDHSGRIWAKSQEGVGTTMCFVLRKYIGGNNE